MWEDPGFVLVEAALANVSIISSNCPNGPKEILDNGNNGYIFETNNLSSFNLIFDKFLNEDVQKQNQRKIKLKILTKKFTLFSHFQILQKSLNEN